MCGWAKPAHAPRDEVLEKRLKVAWLPDGRRLRLRNGPLDVVVQGFGRPSHVGRAYDAAISRAREICQELGHDLPALYEGRAPRGAAAWGALTAVARLPGGLRHGWGACVALNGAIADEVLAAMTNGAPLERGFVNSRGTVALHLAEGQMLDVAVTEWPGQRQMAGRAPLDWTSRTRALVTAGWRFAPYALGCLETLWVGGQSAAQTAASAAAIALEAAPGALLAELGLALERFGERGRAAGQLVLPAGLTLPDDMADELLTLCFTRAEDLRAAGLVTMALMGVGGEERLSAPAPMTLELLNTARH
jgi:ApbE superfamily uncharacterized protein (UPF0280 family)